MLELAFEQAVPKGCVLEHGCVEFSQCGDVTGVGREFVGVRVRGLRGRCVRLGQRHCRFEKGNLHGQRSCV